MKTYSYRVPKSDAMKDRYRLKFTYIKIIMYIATYIDECYIILRLANQHKIVQHYTTLYAFNLLLSPDFPTTGGSLNGPVPLTFIAATLTE